MNHREGWRRLARISSDEFEKFRLNTSSCANRDVVLTYAFLIEDEFCADAPMHLLTIIKQLRTLIVFMKNARIWRGFQRKDIRKKKPHRVCVNS